MTLASIAFGGANYSPGIEYLYNGFLLTPRPDYRIVKVTNEATQKSILLAPYVEGWPSYIMSGVFNVDGWMTVQDAVSATAMFT